MKLLFLSSYTPATAPFSYIIFETLYFAKLNIRIEGPREYKRLKYIVQPWALVYRHHDISTFHFFWVKEKHFWMGVLHGRSNREEITGFAVKRLNVPLLATVTVMPHTTTRASLYLHTHTTRWGCHMLDMKKIMAMVMPYSR